MPDSSIYVSYNWGPEADDPVVDKLATACAARGIELQRDIQKIGYGESIKAFMNKLGAADHVVLVLSDSYLKSDNCMYELREIERHGSLRKRVSPIVLRGAKIYDPIDRFDYSVFWQEKHLSLQEQMKKGDDTHAATLQQKKRDYDDFNREMDQYLNALADMNALTQDVHVETDFTALLDRIAPSKSSKSARDNDASFICRIEDQIRETLARCQPLSSALTGITSSNSHAPVSDLAKFLASIEFSIAIQDYLRPATEAVLRSNKNTEIAKSPEWQSAKEVFLWLTSLVVLPDWLRDIEKQQLQGDFKFEIAVSTPLGVEIVSSRYRQIRSKIRVDSGKADAYGADAFQDSGFDTGWASDYAVDVLLQEIWKQVFPADNRSVLSSSDLKKLNATLAQRDKNKTHHHYIPVAAERQTILTRPGVYERLREKLPALSVVFFGVDSGPAVLRIADEYDFQAMVQSFFMIPVELGNSI